MRELKGADVLPLAIDLLDAAAVAAAVEKAVARFGGIRAAIHLAGGFTMGSPVHETDADTWQRMLDLNVNTMLHSAAAVVPLMRRARRGFIVNVGAASAVRGAAKMGAYIASKSALMRLTESMAAELREDGINVNAVLPTDHRHASQSSVDAEGGPGPLGRTRGARRRDRLPRKRCRSRGARRADTGERA